MKPRDKKLAVLRFLGQEGGPVSLNEILTKLNSDLKERTVRRWLDELVREGLVEKTGLKRAMRYRVLQQKNGKNGVVASSCFGSESLTAIEYVLKPLYERVPVSFNTDWIDSYIPNSNYYLSSELRDQLHTAGKRATNKDPAGTYAHQILNRLLIDLSFNSSRLEGNTYSLLDTERLILS
jgi:DNA-binding transcriptional ArsR family regulator